MKSLTQIANRFQTDKGTQANAAHGYSLVYDLLFHPMRALPRVDILEMGLAIGGPELGGDINRDVAGAPSIDTWLEYFDNAQIVGFDISDFSSIKHDQFTFIRGDSGKCEDLEKVKALGRRFDIILDDASHASYHQQLALAVLFDQLKPGGVYIIEDLSWQPDEIEAKLPQVTKTARLLADYAATGRFRPTEAISSEMALRLEIGIGGVFFYDESMLNAAGDRFNERFGNPAIARIGWRGKGAVQRLLSPYFWLHQARRFKHSLFGQDFVNHQSVKMLVIQKSLKMP
jgi:SAM-dependent methyltransferase